METQTITIRIRRDRETGREEQLTEKYARAKLSGWYKDVELAMASCSKEHPITTGYADYWPND